MKKLIRLFFIFLCFAQLSNLHAMKLERLGNDLYATGPTVDSDFLSFREAFAKDGVQRLILVNGPGGDLWTGMQVARMVQQAKIKTVVSGYCLSACSLIFIAGQERAFGTGYLPRVTLLGIHGAHSKDTKQVNPQAMPQMYALYKQQLGEKFDSTVINQALYDIKESGGFLRIREIERNLEKDRTPWFCPTGQTPFSDCQQHQGKDALSLGLVTQAQTEVLELPESMKLQMTYFGRKLGPPTLQNQDRSDKLMERYCKGQAACMTTFRGAFQNYLTANTHKALAFGTAKPGYGAAWGIDEPGMALLRALYLCNHPKNNPKLCRLVALNDHELTPDDENEALQTEALQKTFQSMPLPTPEVSAQESQEVGTLKPSKLRQIHQLTGMTPRELEGVARWNTHEMVTALKQTERPVLVDVATSGPMIPGALNFIHGGLAFEDEKKEAAFSERFRNMMLAAVPDMNQPVVFYCASSECWLSVNAAMRARQIGYTRVIWYRGGLASWARSGLPTTDRLPVAVLN